MLSEYADIYVPSKDGEGQPLSNQEALLKWLLKEMAHEFGGATATQLVSGWGSYKTSAGVVVIEPIAIVRSFCTDVDSHSDQLRALAGELKVREQQETVAIETPRGMEFV